MSLNPGITVFCRSPFSTPENPGVEREGTVVKQLGEVVLVQLPEGVLPLPAEYVRERNVTTVVNGHGEQ